LNAEKTIGLVMIVKNEAHVIERCLSSVRPLLDYALIVDTGSTDATREKVANFLAANAIRGSVIEHAWVNFAQNRSEALAALRQVEDVDYALTIDADEALAFDADFDVSAFKRRIGADVYDAEIWYGDTIYRRPTLFSNRKALAYKSILHEYLELPPGTSRSVAAGMHVVVTPDGARSRNPNKFAEDAKVLADALSSEADPFLIARYTFYLAQSYRDAGEPQLAYDAYVRRAEMSFWQEEVYVSLTNAAQLAESLGQRVDAQIALYLRAYDLIPTRAEALHGAAAACRRHGRYHLGYLLSRHGITILEPETGLFVDRSVYQYRMLDEFQVNAYWAGNYRESLDAAATILRDAHFPETERQRLTANANFALQKLTQEATATTD
jgi:tetratricopeptide (TPR) repeat protein